MVTAILLLAAIQTLTAQPDRFGLPACDAPGQSLAPRTAFTLCLSTIHNAPLWAAYELTPAMLDASAPRQPFRRDPALAATNADYLHSGYHRSHLVPASDIAAHPQALRESYLLSNTVPQLPRLNLSPWRKIETAIRRLAAESDALYIFTGALFDCDIIRHIGVNQVAVPCATFKVILALQGETKLMFAVTLSNLDESQTPQLASVREIELRTGLNFFPALPIQEQNTLESVVQRLP